VLFEVTGEQLDGACMLAHSPQEGHLRVVWGHCRDHAGSVCGAAYFALAYELPKECLAASHKQSLEAHPADNAFVVGIEKPRVLPQHAGGSVSEPSYPERLAGPLTGQGQCACQCAQFTATYATLAVMRND